MWGKKKGGRGKSKLQFSNMKELVMKLEMWGFHSKMGTVVHSPHPPSSRVLSIAFSALLKDWPSDLGGPFPPKMSKHTSSNTWCQQKIKSRLYIFFLSLVRAEPAVLMCLLGLGSKKHTSMWERRSGVKVCTCLQMLSLAFKLYWLTC